MRAFSLLLAACWVSGGYSQTTPPPSTSDICSAAQAALSNGAITSEQRVQLAQALRPALTAAGGPIQCTIAGATTATTLWFIDVTAQQPFTFTSANAPPVTVTNWGTTIPILAAVTTYPQNPPDPRFNWGCTVGWAVFIDRMTYAGVPVNNPNPLTFQVGPIGREVESVRVSDTIGSTAGTPLIASGGQWSQANGGVTSVTSPKGVTFAGCVDDDHSPLGLLGLLGLIAIPVCCCCCLLPLIWWCLRRKKNINWCCPQQQCGMQQNCCQPAAVEVQMLPVYQTAGDCPYY